MKKTKKKAAKKKAAKKAIPVKTKAAVKVKKKVVKKTKPANVKTAKAKPPVKVKKKVANKVVAKKAAPQKARAKRPATKKMPLAKMKRTPRPKFSLDFDVVEVITELPMDGPFIEEVKGLLTEELLGEGLEDNENSEKDGEDDGIDTSFR
jgi:hypothetical protein